MVVGLLVVVWVALWGELTVANVASGVLVAIGSLVAVPLDPPVGSGRFRLGPAVSYGLYFARSLVVANLVVAWEVLTPRNRDNEGIVAVPVAPSCSRTVLMVVVNSIGLTPGTVVVEISEDLGTLFVHVLHLDDVDASRRALVDLEVRALRAFGSDAARDEAEALLAALDRDPSQEHL